MTPEETTKARKSAWHRENRKNPTYRARHLLHGAKYRAAKRGVPFSLSLGWAVKRVGLGRCEVTGIPFDFEPDGRGAGYRNPFGPTLDQKVAGLGYTEDNTQVVCWTYNGAKGSSDHASVMRMVEALRVH